VFFRLWVTREGSTNSTFASVKVKSRQCLVLFCVGRVVVLFVCFWSLVSR